MALRAIDSANSWQRLPGSETNSLFVPSVDFIKNPHAWPTCPDLCELAPAVIDMIESMATHAVFVLIADDIELSDERVYVIVYVHISLSSMDELASYFQNLFMIYHVS